MSKTQSVILNLNKEYSNSEASDYFAPVAQQLDIGPQCEVAMYGAVIKREPIFISKDNKDNTFNWQIDAQVFPDNRQVLNASAAATDVLDIDKLPISSIEEFGSGFKVEAGPYTVNEFGNRLVEQVNSNITNIITGQTLTNSSDSALTCGGLPMVQQFPYSYTFDNSRDGHFYLGFQGYAYQQSDTDDPILLGGKLTNSQTFVTDNSETRFTIGGGTRLNYNTEPTGAMRACTGILSNTAISVTDYSAFAQVHVAPLKPLFKQQKQLDSVSTVGENETYFEFNIKLDETDNNKDTDIYVGFTNTFLQSGWTSSNQPALMTNNHDTLQSIPQTFLGVRIIENVQSGVIQASHAEIFVAAKINEYTDYLDNMTELANVFGSGANRVCKIDLDERLAETGKMGFRFYAVDNQMNFLQGQEEQLESGAGSINPSSNRRFPRAYGFQFYFRPVSGAIEIVYDSKNDNLYIPPYYLDDGFCFNSARSQRDATKRCNLGFQPYFFANNLEAEDGLLTPRGNYVAQKDHNNNEIVYRYGLDYYSYVSTNTNFLSVLGLPEELPDRNVKFPNVNVEFKRPNEKRFDGNAYPEFPKLAGITKLYSDSTQYNIEVNLPVKAYTTTQPPVNQSGNKISVPGQKRTIVYKTEPVLDGELQGVEQTYIDKNILPNNLKYLTLDNDKPLNINELNVQIRRAKTNKLATELKDASVELLLKSN